MNTGYISKEISNAEGKFTTNPVVTITMEAIRAYYGFELIFGQVLPSDFTVRTYGNGKLVNEFSVAADEID
ncbi:hypothetical protein RFX70_11850, partial [Acinetobacter baumannii]|nr:hypothetical protein [Acinetobacter baumannii]